MLDAGWGHGTSHGKEFPWDVPLASRGNSHGASRGTPMGIPMGRTGARISSGKADKSRKTVKLHESAGSGYRAHSLFAAFMFPFVRSVQRIPPNLLLAIGLLVKTFWGGAPSTSQTAAYTSKGAHVSWIVGEIRVVCESPNVAKVQRIPVNAFMAFFFYRSCWFLGVI